LIFYYQRFTDIVLMLGRAFQWENDIVLQRQTIGRSHQVLKQCQ